jgi:hypothetical protein
LAALASLGGVRRFMCFFLPLKKPTPLEYAVLVSSSMLFPVVGVIELVFAIRAPESNNEFAVALAY